MHLTAKQIIALEGSSDSGKCSDSRKAARPQRCWISRPATGRGPQDHDSQADLGEFRKSGVRYRRSPPISAGQIERLKLKKQLAEIERELEVLGGKEPKNGERPRSL